MDSKYKYLIKNIGLMTISNFSSKILSFLLVPLYTSVLTTSEYGTYDFYVTTILLLTPLLSSNIIDAVIRFSLDKANNPRDVFSIGLRYCIRADVLCFIIIVINLKFEIFDNLTQYPIYFMMYFTFSLFSDLMNQFARGMEKLFDVAVAGIINSIVVVALNLYFLLYLKFGLDGYFLAYIIAFSVTSIYLIIRLNVWKYIRFPENNLALKKEMVSYSRPLILQNIGSWINNLSDRYVVIWLCGTAANGVYSVSYKIPSILTVFQTIFNQAWTISAVKSYAEKQEEFYTSIYKVYNLGFVLICSILLILDKFISKILFAQDFYVAWRYAPFLIISVVFSSMSSLLGGIFVAAKKSGEIAKTTTAGAAVNTALNIVFVWMWGPVGAAIATLISYFLVWITRIIALPKLIELKINIKRDLVIYIILVCQAIMLLFVSNNIVLYFGESIFLFTIVCLMWGDIKFCFNSIGKSIKNVRDR